MREIPDVEIDEIMAMGSLSTWQTQVLAAQNNTKLLKQKADYNQISACYIALQNAKSERVKKRLEEEVAYIEWKAPCDQYLQNAYNGRVNNIVEELRKIKSDGFDALSEAKKAEFTKLSKDELSELLEELGLDSTKESRNKLRAERKQEFVTTYFEEKLQAKIAELRHNHLQKIKNLEQQIRELIIQKPFNETRVVWVAPTLAVNKDQEPIDQFLYSGKTASKTVMIPFRQVHQGLIQDNYRIRNGKTVKNIIVGSFIFVISDAEHPNEAHPADKYEDGRTWVEVAIIADQQGLIKTGKSSDHSEAALKQLLEQDSYLEKLLNQLKDAIKAKLEIDDVANIKVYQTILFLNSELNACKGYGCSKTLYEMQRGLGDSTFLRQLQDKLLYQGFVLSRKAEGVGKYTDGAVQKLRMQVSYSSGGFTNSDGFYDKHASEAKLALDGDLHNLSIDVHSLNAEVILETPNWAIGDDVVNSEYKEVIGLREQKKSLFHDAVMANKSLDETFHEQQDFSNEALERLRPIRSAFASGHAQTAEFELERWSNKVIEQSSDVSTSL